MQRAHLGLLLLWLLQLASTAKCSWGDPDSSQYHIQTDEGPERYFRFQTDNGQFRKEKRLQDGTVIGTEAWIDAAGFLRQKDYIADKKGYRILKSKTIFVGHGRPIQDAIKSTKGVPAQSGVLVDGSEGGNNVLHSSIGSAKNRGYVYSTTTPSPAPIAVSSTTLEPPKLGYLSPAQAANLEPSPYLGFDHYPDELPRARYHQRQPIVHIRPHSQPLEEPRNSISGDDYHEHVLDSTTAAPPITASPTPSQPSIDMLPPFESHARRARPIRVFATSPAPIAAYDSFESSTPRTSFGYAAPAPFTAAASPAPTPHGYHYAPSTDDDDARSLGYYPSTSRTHLPPALSPLDVNQLDGGLLPPLPPPAAHYRRLRPPSALHTNNIQEYGHDEISATRNGFRYYLPHQYHEEEQFEGAKRAGSYGYVDPFGIRRVVYYNASPQRGFVHRNNNNYVGLDATPYDQEPRSTL